ncbi:MAG: DNA polymerase III subunit delta' [Actinobacteria bacterium]|nr:MAG: DNA polymerase III subunit delta' [Actinomycetota bacterium]
MVFKSIFGQEKAINLLQHDIDSGKVAHAYLFSGPAGIGKMKTALQFSKATACLEGGCLKCMICSSFEARIHPDFKLIKKQGNFISIKQIRELEHWVVLKANQAEKKVVIIKDIECLTEEAANALLKTLEEPQESTVFISLTSNLNAVLPTIISRCRQVKFRAISREVLLEYLLNQGYDNKKARLAVNLSQGVFGKALDLMKTEKLFELRNVSLNCLRKALNSDPNQIGFLVESLLATIKKFQEKEIDNASFAPADLPPKLTKEMKAKIKRAASVKGQELLLQALDFWWLWLRDVVVFSETADRDSIVNSDLFDEIDEYCQNSEVRVSWCIVEKISEVKTMIKNNINSQLALETLLLESTAQLAKI